eukprot:293614-Pleurochrysis_carterae.AAC.2
MQYKAASEENQATQHLRIPAKWAAGWGTYAPALRVSRDAALLLPCRACPSDQSRRAARRRNRCARQAGHLPVPEFLLG